jgi:ABC-2 type transport system ATP-binding protein
MNVTNGASAPAVEVIGLHKRYGDRSVLRGVDLTIDRGEVFALLGPNGAGKTTTVRILTTLARPDSGSARVAGFDVVSHGREVRRRIGVTGQSATLDELLTGRQNLTMVGELSRLPRRRALARAAELLERFELVDAADRVVKGYSGGMRRRLDLAASLVAQPPVLFLDEPTTGLDPASRARMWEVIRELVSDGCTLLLTTQYLDEADTLADRIVVIDHGTVIAEGTSSELKTAIGGEQLEVTLTAPAERAARALEPLVTGRVHVSADGRRLRAPVRTARGLATEVVRALDLAGVAVDDIEVHHPSLDDVFFALTGRPTSSPEADDLADDPPDDLPDDDRDMNDRRQDHDLEGARA